MSDKIQQLVGAIAQLDPKDPAHFTKNRLPDSRVLGERIQEAVSAKERDEAWAVFLEQHPDAAAVVAATEKPSAKPEPTPEEKSDVVTGQDALKHLRKKGYKV